MIRLLLFLVCLFSSIVSADEHIEYIGTPLNLSLTQGQERQIVFEESIQAGVTGALVNKVKLTSIGNRVFIEPISDFSNQRLLVRGAESGTTYVFTLQSATDITGLDPIVNIYLPKPKAPTSSDGLHQAWSVKDKPINSYPYLTRYAMKHLYAPARLVKTHPAIQPITHASNSIMLFRCSERSTACRSIKATPLLGFKTDRLFVTALKLQNLGSQAQEIDPRLIKVSNPSSLLAATTMHGRLLGNEYGAKAETVIVLIHDRPFRDVIGGIGE